MPQPAMRPMGRDLAGSFVSPALKVETSKPL